MEEDNLPRPWSVGCHLWAVLAGPNKTSVAHDRKSWSRASQLLGSFILLKKINAGRLPRMRSLYGLNSPSMKVLATSLSQSRVRYRVSFQFSEFCPSPHSLQRPGLAGLRIKVPSPTANPHMNHPLCKRLFPAVALNNHFQAGSFRKT